jgi:type IV pilus assembly protein PilW
VKTGRVTPCRQTGVSLIELMLAMLIGLLLLSGMVAVQQQGGRIHRAVQTVGRLQEVARLALDVIEADVRMANHWGLHSQAGYIVNRGLPDAGLPPGFSTAQGERIGVCGGPNSHWAIHLDEYLGGSNGGYDLACPASGAASGSADTLVVRRAADSRPASLDPDRIYLQTSRLAGTLFVPQAGCASPANAACIPAGYAPATSVSRALVVHAYYVSPNSTQRAGLPGLRRKSFGNVNATSPTGALQDDEIVAGVEDLQVRFGVDTDGDASLDDYVDPGAVPAGARIVAATIWLRVRSEDPEAGYVDDTAYQYAGMASAWTPGDGHRRVVVSKTIHLRNTRS